MRGDEDGAGRVSVATPTCSEEARYFLAGRLAETDFDAGDFFAAGLAAGFLATAFAAGLAAAFLAGAFAAVFGLAAGFLAATAFFAAGFAAAFLAGAFAAGLAAVFGLAAAFLAAGFLVATAFDAAFAAGLAAAFLAGAGLADFFGAAFPVTFDILTSSLSLIISFGFGICNLLCTVAWVFLSFLELFRS